MTPEPDPKTAQTRDSVASNTEFFRDSATSYRHHVETLDTYASIRAKVDEALRGTHRLLDIGNGGVFDYDAASIPSVVAVDLFLHQGARPPAATHVRFLSGSALSLPVADRAFDGVVINMLLHHLVGNTVAESLANARAAIAEAARVLQPGGRLVLIESCVPAWFFAFERIAFPPARRMIKWVTTHPVTLQFTPDMIGEVVKSSFGRVEVARSPKGRWVLQYGVKVPSVFTPAMPYRFVAVKSR